MDGTRWMKVLTFCCYSLHESFSPVTALPRLEVYPVYAAGFEIPFGVDLLLAATG